MSQQQQSLPGVAVDANPWIDGIVSRVTWFDEESGSIIMRVNVDGYTEAWLGKSGPLREGAAVRGRGPMEKHPKYGSQRKCSAILPVLPVTAEAMRAFLAGGNVAGIGPATANLIVDKFGAQTKHIFDNAPNELLKVKGIGQKTLEKIQQSWAEVAVTADVMAFFAERGISGGVASKVIRQYGSRTINIVSSQPYRLALEVPGIGFKIADDIAGAMGISPDSPERAQAGVMHALHEATKRGDCYVPVDVLTRKAHELLGDGCADPIEAIDTLAITPRPAGKGRPDSPLLVVEGIGEHHGQHAVYPRALHRAEVDLAERIRELLNAPSKPIDGAEDAIDQFECAGGVRLAPEQRAAVEAAAAHNMVIVTGPPGSGKSTIAKAILAAFDRAQIKYALASPTGRAAKRLSETTGREAATFHRLLGVQAGPDGSFDGFIHNRKNPLGFGAVLGDELSMADCQLANHVMQAIKVGARVVLVGDVDQLPSVGPGAVLRDVIESGVVPTVRLTQVFRQKAGSAILDAALAVNSGHSPRGPSIYSVGRGEFFVETDFARDAEDVSAAAVDLIVDIATNVIPSRYGMDPLRDVQTIVPTVKGTCGTVELNRCMQAVLNPHGESIEVGPFKFRVGDKVINVKNNYEANVFNGDIGTIVSVDREESKAIINIDGRAIEFTKEMLRDVMLGYAITGHRFQGSESPAVVVGLLPEHFMLATRPWTYTALTRGKRLVSLVTVPRTLAMAVRETRREVRRTMLASRLRG